MSEFPLMYEESPASILILPPINESTAAEAKEYYSTTIQEPLAYNGYYTFPYPITADILRMEGIYDSELLVNMPLAKFKEYFGADAVLFTSIKKWDVSYMVLASSLTVSIDCDLKSTISEQTIWNYTGTVVVDLSGGNTGGGIAGLVAQAIVTAVNTAMADYVPYARQANYRALASMPCGKHHSQHNKDQHVQFIDQTPEESTTE
ncbi:MAG: GNA1162 family protein [Desulforhopalus sp.]